MSIINQLTPGLWQISLPFQGEQDVVGAYLFEGHNAEGQRELVLLDPGPDSTAEALLTILRNGGWDPADVTHILITHIHLDHSGGVGTLLPHMPQARIFVHSRGAPHLSDPAKLIQSATRIYRENMQKLWGRIEAVPAERVNAIDDGDTLTVAGRQLRVYYTPGHASHHVIFFDPSTAEIFAGDVAGVRLQGVDFVRPPTPPPDIDLEGWSRSISLMESLHPNVLYLAHYGPEHNTTRHLHQLRAKLTEWGEFVLQEMRAGKDTGSIVKALIAHVEPELRQKVGDATEISHRYDLTANYEMSVEGYIRYWQKQHPERLLQA